MRKRAPREECALDSNARGEDSLTSASIPAGGLPVQGMSTRRRAKSVLPVASARGMMTVTRSVLAP